MLWAYNLKSGWWHACDIKTPYITRVFESLLLPIYLEVVQAVLDVYPLELKGSYSHCRQLDPDFYRRPWIRNHWRVLVSYINDSQQCLLGTTVILA
jgi:hypothetical protein